MLIPAFMMCLFYWFKIKERLKREKDARDEEAGASQKPEGQVQDAAVPEMEGTPVCELDPGLVQEVDGKEICEVDGLAKVELDGREVVEADGRTGKLCMSIVG